MTDLRPLLDSIIAIEEGFKTSGDQIRGAPELWEQYFAAMTDLVDAYLAADDAGRKAVRDAVEKNFIVHWRLFSYIAAAQDRIEEGGGVEWLRRALAAASIEDNRMDYRDMTLTLGELYEAAHQAGLEPDRYFHEIALLSSTEPLPGGGRIGSMQKFLMGYVDSVYFRNYVKPSLDDEPEAGE